MRVDHKSISNCDKGSSAGLQGLPATGHSAGSTCRFWPGAAPCPCAGCLPCHTAEDRNKAHAALPPENLHRAAALKTPSDWNKHWNYCNRKSRQSPVAVPTGHRARGSLGQRMESWPWGHPKIPAAQKIPPLGLHPPQPHHPHRHPVLMISISTLIPISILPSGPGTLRVRAMSRELGCPSSVLDGSCASTGGWGTPQPRDDAVPWQSQLHRRAWGSRGAEQGARRALGPAAGCSHPAVQGAPLSWPAPQSCTDGGGGALNQTLYSQGFYTAQTHIPSPCTAPPAPRPGGCIESGGGGTGKPQGPRGAEPARPATPALRARGPQGPALLPQGRGGGGHSCPKRSPASAQLRPNKLKRSESGVAEGARVTPPGAR